MEQDNVAATFAGVLEKVAKVDRATVARDKRLRDDLGIDSLSLIEAAVAAEDAFGAPIPDEDLETLPDGRRGRRSHPALQRRPLKRRPRAHPG